MKHGSSVVYEARGKVTEMDGSSLMCAKLQQNTRNKMEIAFGKLIKIIQENKPNRPSSVSSHVVHTNASVPNPPASPVSRTRGRADPDISDSAAQRTSPT